MHFLIVIIFRSLLFAELALLAWFDKSTKFGEGFNDNEQL